MATTKKKKARSSGNPGPSAEVQQAGKQIRLALGIFFLLSGTFICFSIISYFFTWQADQDKLMVPGGLSQFLWHSEAPVANWGGRMGAALAHILVFRGMGIAALVLGIWTGCAGINLLYGRKYFALVKYLRWFASLVLIGAPILTFLLPKAAFPFGGAWGNEAISYLNGLTGKAGTGMLLLGICSFWLFVIIALDIKPLLSKAKSTAKSLTTPAGDADADTDEEEDEEMADPVAPVTPGPVAVVASAEENGADILAQYRQPSAQAGSKKNLSTEPSAPVASIVQAPEMVHDADDEVLTAEEEEEEEPPFSELDLDTIVPPGKEDFSFEVIQQDDEPAAVLDDHKSVADHEGELYAPELDLPSYKFPTLDLMEDRSESFVLDKEELEKNKNQIIQTLRSFGIEIQRISATVGPTVTLYEIVPAEGVRISKIRNLEDDIALNLAALGIRIIAPIPGRGTIGIEVPNANKQIVSMKALLASEKFVNSKMSLPIALGKKIDNENYIVDLATMPHLLMAGATGQGKSVGINAILVSLLYKKHPSQLKFVMVDPKKVELSIYRVIEKHFLAKLPNEEEAIITDTKKVIYTLNALCIEMDNRYELLKEAGARNIKEYNEKFINRRLNPLRGHKYLPFIVLVIDEFADLIMTAGKEVEMPIARLAQLARAVGIHLIIATQRPSVNVITGTIKANFPGRIAFKVSAKVDSRTILDTGGAEQLIGRGDMLVSHGSELLRLQCAFVDTPEVEKVVSFIGNQRGYPTAFELPEYEGEDEDGGSKIVDLTNRDKLFEECAKVVVQTQSGSTSMLQRRFNLGYNRAGRIMDQLEAAGIVGPAMGSKPRDVLFHTEAELEQFLSSLQ